MHPNPLFRTDDHALLESMIDEIGFGTVFASLPDGPRAAHTPVLSDGNGGIRFHLANRNALTPHLAGSRALITITGPDAYVSPRWYDNRDTVPTWDYAAIEMQGQVTQLGEAALEDFLNAIIGKFESRIEGEPWLASESSEAVWKAQLKGITGFEMQVSDWRPTLKLSQKKNAAERARIAAGHDARGKSAIAILMREITP